MQSFGIQHALVKLSRLLGAEHQDLGKGSDWLEWDRVRVDQASRTQVGPLPAVDHAHLDLRICRSDQYQIDRLKLQVFHLK